jgi:hypothetical protein
MILPLLMSEPNFCVDLTSAVHAVVQSARLLLKMQNNHVTGINYVKKTVTAGRCHTATTNLLLLLLLLLLPSPPPEMIMTVFLSS